jgi:DNA-binding transcriptional ArsR family regulator
LLNDIAGGTGKVNRVVEHSALDAKYAALADPVRRAILVALRAGEARITDLAAPFPMTFAGVSRHIGVLEKAVLVTRERRGREHWLHLTPGALDDAQEWMREQAAFWAPRLDALTMSAAPAGAGAPGDTHARAGRRDL